VLLNGEAVGPYDIQGEDGITTIITVEDENGEGLKKSITGTLTLYGRAWEIVRDELIEPADGLLREVPFVVLDNCTTPPKEVFRGVVQGSAVDWCEGACSATVTAVERTEVSAAMDCLKSTLVYEGLTDEAGHPRMVYCDEIRPDWLHASVLIVAQFALWTLDIVNPIVFSIAVMITVINAIASLIPGVNGIDFDGNPDTNTFQEWLAVRQRIYDTIIGCGRVHPSPLVRRYIGKACETCGIAFQSSILNNPSSDYWNLVLFNAPVKKGTRNDNTRYIYENRPIMSAHRLLEDLREVFNARYDVRVIAGVPTLMFERRDMLPPVGPWVDPMQLKDEGRLVGDLCYEWADEAPAAYASIGFSEDGMDEPGNEARDQYRDIIEWNQPFNPAQKGEKQKQFKFGMNRNRRDGIDADTLDTFVWHPFLFTRKNLYGNAMMLSRGIAALPKLLIWNGDNPGTVRRYNVPGYGFDQPYNWPMHCNAHGLAPNEAPAHDAPGRNLYARFHAIDNPKVMEERRIRFKFEFEYTAEHLATMNPYASIPLPIAGGINGRITSITINHSRRTILVAGKA
jgi:hypothetical protein